MEQESINNLMHIKKILSLEFNKIMLKKDKDLAHRDYYLNIIQMIDLTLQNIEIACDPSKHIQIKKRCNPDENKSIKS